MNCAAYCANLSGAAKPQKSSSPIANANLARRTKRSQHKITESPGWRPRSLDWVARPQPIVGTMCADPGLERRRGCGMSAPTIVPSARHAHIGAARALNARRYSGGAPAEVVEDGPGIAGRLAW